MTRRFSRKGCSTVERVELGDDLPVPPGPHVGVDACLERGETDLVQSRDLAVETAVALHIGVGMTAPHQQRVAEPTGHVIWIDQRGSGPAGVFELDRVDRGATGSQQVRIAVADENVTERAAQVGDVGVQRRSVGRGGVLAVHALQQSVDRHGPSGGRDEEREHGSLLGTSHDEHVAVVGDDVERAKDAVPHGRAGLLPRNHPRRFTGSSCAPTLNDRSTRPTPAAARRSGRWPARSRLRARRAACPSGASPCSLPPPDVPVVLMMRCHPRGVQPVSPTGWLTFGACDGRVLECSLSEPSAPIWSTAPPCSAIPCRRASQRGGGRSCNAGR